MKKMRLQASKILEKPRETMAANNEDCTMKADRKDPYSLHVKKEFVLTQRDASLPAVASLTSVNTGDAVHADNDKNDDDRGNNNHNNHKNNKKKRGMNRKRPRDARQDNSAKLCMSVLRKEPCPFADKNCRFSHDLQEYMKLRPADLETAYPQDIQCPHYTNYGNCPYGPMCRLGSIHINAQGENVDKETVTEPPLVLNAMSRNVQDQLRKKKYPFQCQRYDQVKKKEQNGDKKAETSTEGASIPTTTTNTTSTSLSASSSLLPLPMKERKLIDFSNKVYIAPLTTVGNLPFRRIMKGFGADITCGEMALCSQLVEGKPSEWALLKRHASEDVFGVQLAAGYPDLFTRSCELIEAEATVDFVDLNLGCPIDLVCKKGAGASLMLRDRRLKESLLSITKTLSCPVTVKMRTGWDMNKPVAHSLVPRIVHKWELPAGSIAAIMVHGRSRLQRYSKEADWDYIQQVAKTASSTTTTSLGEEQALPDPDNPPPPSLSFLSTLPHLIGNGDIFSYIDYEQKVLARGPELSSCAMLGRGALIKPWLPTEIRERRHWDISATERLDILKDFVRFGLEHWGSDQQGVNNCRRFLLEWLSFLHRYVPVGILEVIPQQMNHRPPNFMRGRNDLETLFLSNQSADWIKISEMLLGPVPDDFRFEPKHKARSYDG